jgi:hypothetical protein
MNRTRWEPLAIQIGDNDAEIHFRDGLTLQRSRPTKNGQISLISSPLGAENRRFTRV